MIGVGLAHTAAMRRTRFLHDVAEKRLLALGSDDRLSRAERDAASEAVFADLDVQFRGVWRWYIVALCGESLVWVGFIGLITAGVRAWFYR